MSSILPYWLWDNLLLLLGYPAYARASRGRSMILEFSHHEDFSFPENFLSNLLFSSFNPNWHDLWKKENPHVWGNLHL